MASKWTTIRTYSSFEEAEIDKGLLQANGIPCVLNNATISSVYPMTDTWAPLELMIPTAMKSEAEELLKR